MDLAPTKEEIDAALDHRRTPSNHDLDRLLQALFEPTADTAIGARLEAELRDLLGDPPRKFATASAFEANGRDYRGQAWKEQISHHRLPPTPTELAIWLAVTTPGHPRPRPYCPSPFIGVWRQLQPTTATWHLDPDGGMRSDDTALAERTHWCVHRIKPRAATFVDDELWFSTKGCVARSLFAICELTDRTLGGFRSGLDGRIDYKLERA
jgi:hypothetical protein